MSIAVSVAVTLLVVFLALVALEVARRNRWRPVERVADLLSMGPLTLTLGNGESSNADELLADVDADD